MRKWSLFVVIALAAAGLVVVLVPFDRPLPRGSFTYESSASSSSCASPVVSAWRHDSADSGWFGYAPLTSTPYSAPMSCKAAGRRRLALGGTFMAAAALVLLLLRRNGSRPLAPDERTGAV